MTNSWVKWIEVEGSESIKKLCYRNNKLFVVYKKSPKETFVYAGVSEATVKKMFKSKSIGGFINQYIKPHHTLSTKIKTTA
jgi:hypothetical protein